MAKTTIETMPNSIFAYIFKYSSRQQAIACATTLIYLPILYMSFELPKVIVNDALDLSPGSFPREIAGFNFEQLPYLMVLCGGLLTLVLITAGIRYFLSVYKGVLGEIMLRRLRYDLYTRILQFPMSHLRKIQGGEIVTMATAEVEPLGRYMGVAVANPTLQGGTMLTALVFLFAQDWLLGLAAISLFPVQAYLVPKFQKKLNAASRERLANVRLFAGHIGETITGYRDIHVNDTTAYELAKAADRLGVLFRIRRRLYKIGNTIIFLNNFFTHLTPFMFYSIGGWLVINGELTLGALIAVIAAYRETAAPWNELLDNYQALEDNRVKYAALVENFMPEGMRQIPDCEDCQEAPEPIALAGGLRLANVTLKDGEEAVLDGVSLEFPLPGRVAILGPAGSGKAELAQLLAALRPTAGGSVALGGRDMSEISTRSLGRCVGYVDSVCHIFTGSWRDNLYYGLKHRPIGEGDGANRVLWVAEARAAGNTVNDFNAEWVDFEAVGAASAEHLHREAARIIDLVGLTEDLVAAGMREPLGGSAGGLDPAFSEALLSARRRFREELSASAFADAVEFFDPETYNTNAAVAENLLFGRTRDGGLDVHVLAADVGLTEVLEAQGLLAPLVEIGHVAIANIVGMFRDLGPGDDQLGRFSFIESDSMPKYESLLRRVPKVAGVKLAARDTTIFLAAALQLIPAEHRLGLIDGDMQARLLRARKSLLANMPAKLATKIERFDPDRVAVSANVRFNVLFGRLVRSRAQHRDEVEALLARVVEEAGLRGRVVELGLGSSVGAGGSRLVAAQKQRLALARALVKKPELLIVNEALTALDAAEQARLMRRIIDDAPGRGLIWIDREHDGFEDFDRVFIMRGGRVAEERGPGGRKVSAAAVVGAVAAADLPQGSFADDIQVLDEVPLLSGVSPETLKLIAFTSECLDFAAGETLFSQGEAGDATFIIIDGKADVIVGVGDNERLIGTHGSGIMVGEMALLSDQPRTATVRAHSHLKVLRLSRDLFFDLVRKDANLGLSVMRGLADRLAQATKQLEAAE